MLTRMGTGWRETLRTELSARGVGVVTAQMRSQAAGRYLKRSPGFRLRDEKGELIPERVKEAEAYALGTSAKLCKGEEQLRSGCVTLRTVLDLYLQHRTPRKSAREQKADQRCAMAWKRVLGTGADPYTIRLADWERFIDERRPGAIDARGERVTPADRKPVRPGTAGGGARAPHGG